MDVYGTKSVVHDAIMKTQLYLKSMETTSEQTHPMLPKQHRIYGASTLKSNYNSNNNNKSNETNHNLNVGKSDSAEKSNKVVYQKKADSASL